MPLVDQRAGVGGRDDDALSEPLPHTPRSAHQPDSPQPFLQSAVEVAGAGWVDGSAL